MSEELKVVTQILLPKEELLMSLQKAIEVKHINLQKIAEEELSKINIEELVREEVQKTLREYIRKEVKEDIPDYSRFIKEKIIQKSLRIIIEEI